MLPHAPGVQVQPIPEDGAVIEDSEAEEKVNPDERLPQRDLDKRIQHENEYSDSEDEGEGGRRDNRSFKVTSIIIYKYRYFIISHFHRGNVSFVLNIFVFKSQFFLFNRVPENDHVQKKDKKVQKVI